MSLTYIQLRLPGYVRVTIAGKPTVRELICEVNRIAKEGRTWAERRLLIDARLIAPVPDAVGQALVGDQIGQHLGAFEKIASLVPAAKITRHSQRAALQQGVNLRVFSAEFEALAWLLED